MATRSLLFRNLTNGRENDFSTHMMTCYSRCCILGKIFFHRNQQALRQDYRLVYIAHPISMNFSFSLSFQITSRRRRRKVNIMDLKSITILVFTLISTVLLLSITVSAMSGSNPRKLNKRQIDENELYPGRSSLIEKRPFCNAFTGCGKRSFDDDTKADRLITGWTRVARPDRNSRFERIPWDLFRRFHPPMSGEIA